MKYPKAHSIGVMAVKKREAERKRITAQLYFQPEIETTANQLICKKAVKQSGKTKMYINILKKSNISLIHIVQTLTFTCVHYRIYRGGRDWDAKSYNFIELPTAYCM